MLHDLDPCGYGFLSYRTTRDLRFQHNLLQVVAIERLKGDYISTNDGKMTKALAFAVWCITYYRLDLEPLQVRPGWSSKEI